MRREGGSRSSRWLLGVVGCCIILVLTGCLQVKGPLHNGKTGGYYKTKITITGGTGKYQCTLTSGALPSGLNLAQDGTISGTIDSGVDGIYTFTVKAVDTILPEKWAKGEKTLSIQVDDTPYKWTLITHFAVDNNIDYEFEQQAGIITLYLETLEEIEAQDLNNDIQIILMMDAYNPDTKFADGYYYLSGGDIADDLMVPINEINSGALDDTTAFLKWAVERYPSEHYMYSIFDHGSGFDDQTTVLRVLGIGFDSSSGNDRLTHYELGQATAYLSQLIGGKVDVFYPFACLMGGIELAYEIRDNVDYLLSSEEAFPADIFSYQGFGAAVDNPDITPEVLATGMCDQAYDLLGDRMLNPRSFNLSVVDLSKIGALSDAINAFALAALTDINSDQAVAALYNQAADNSFSMLADEDIDDYYYVDLGDFLDHVLISEGIDADVKTQATAVLSALSAAVLYQQQNNYPQSSGLTIFHNIWGAADQYSPALYRQNLLFGANAWTDYMTMLSSLQP